MKLGRPKKYGTKEEAVAAHGVQVKQRQEMVRLAKFWRYLRVREYGGTSADLARVAWRRRYYADVEQSRVQSREKLKRWREQNPEKAQKDSKQ